MADIEPFKINVPEERLTHLRKRLELTTFPNELADAEWSQGAPLADIKRLYAYWLDKFDWRAQEEKLNSALPQFQTPIPVDGFGDLKIHFVHAKSTVKNAIPLLFGHGWPGSFIEVLKILPGLVKAGGDAPAFHVVAPSLPGYGFSEGAKKKGFGPMECAQAYHKLMLKLGYDKYVTQGGDWGYAVTRCMAIQYPQSCLANHLNFFIPSFPKIHQAPLTFLRTVLGPWPKNTQAGFDRAKWFQEEGAGYFKQQATKPQTLAYSQADSPVGLLGWIYEKLHDWTDAYPWTEDEVLTWISIYWFAEDGPVGGMRLYYESEHSKQKVFDRVGQYVPGVKLGLSRFPKELVALPMFWNGRMGPVVFEAEHDEGGHFAAWEKPDAIVKDLRTMFGKNGGAYNVVPGKSGYDGGSGGNSRL